MDDNIGGDRLGTLGRLELEITDEKSQWDGDSKSSWRWRIVERPVMARSIVVG